MRSLWKVAAGVLAAGAMLTGCISGGGEPAADQSEQSKSEQSKYAGEVEWWTINLQKNYPTYIQGLIDSYQKQHPDVKIRWVDVPGQDITTKLLAAIAGDKVPDVVNFTSFTTGLFGNSMTDLGELFSKDDLATYAPALLDKLKSTDGKQIAIPWYNGGAGVAIYRKSALEGTGFDPANPPKTWDDALALAQKVHDTKGGYGTNAMAYSYTLQSEGIKLISDDRKKAAFATPEAAAVLEKYKKNLDSGAIAPGVLGKDARSYAQNLSNKLIAFMPKATSTDVVLLQNNSPDVYEDIVVTPAVTGAPGDQLLNGQQVFGIPNASDNKAAAAEWLKFVTNADNQLGFCKISSIYPSALKTLEDPHFTSTAGETPIDEARKVLVDTFPKIVDATLGSQNDERMRELLDEEVRTYMRGSKSADEALKAAAAAWDTELAKAS